MYVSCSKFLIFNNLDSVQVMYLDKLLIIFKMNIPSNDSQVEKFVYETVEHNKGSADS
jgi:hypothetical protein